MPSNLPSARRTLASASLVLALLVVFLLLSGPTLLAAPPVAPPSEPPEALPVTPPSDPPEALPSSPPAARPSDAPWVTSTTTVNATPLGPGSGPAPWSAVAAFSGTSNLVALYADFTYPNYISVARSTDNGVTWTGQKTLSAGKVSSPLVNAPPLSLAVSGTNTVHAAWIDAQMTSGAWALYYMRSTDSGANWPAQPVSVTSLFGPNYSPDIVSSGNNVYIAWESMADVQLAKSSNGGVTWGAPTVIHNLPSAVLKGDLSLVQGPTTTLNIAWDQPSTSQDVCFSRSFNNGTNWSAAACTAAPAGATAPTDPDLAFDPSNSRLHLVYVDNSSGVSVVKARYSTNSGVSWSTAVAVSDPAFTATEPTIAVYSSTVYVAWTDLRAPGSPLDSTDIFYTRSTDGGATWGTPGRVNEYIPIIFRTGIAANVYLDQVHPYLTAGSNGPRAIWSDWRPPNAYGWDLYSAGISGACSFPITAATVLGDGSPLPGIQTAYSALISPTAATVDKPINYIWSAAGLSGGQGTADASYTWYTPGTYAITVTASNCGGPVSASRVVTVQCNLPLTAVFITTTSGANWRTFAGAPLVITATTTPVTPNPTVVYNWSTAGLVSGQGTPSAAYLWTAVGTYPVTLTATNCGGTVTDTTSVDVIDTMGPAWGGISPAGWISSTLTPSISTRVTDTQSGLDLSTIQYYYSTNGGGSWIGLVPSYQPGATDGITATLAVTATSVPFGKESGLPAQTRVRFQGRDMAGNLGVGGEYSVTIDTLPPTNPALITVTGRTTSVWAAGFSAPVAWTAATDSSSGVAGYSYLWSQNSDELPPAVISTGGLGAATLIPGYGQHWYFHVRAVDVAGNWSPTATHKGPYWVGVQPSAFLTLDPESSGQGGEVILTGFGWTPMVDAGVYFTSAGGGIVALGAISVSVDGTFQAVQTVPNAQTGVAHGFQVSQTGGISARANFSVTAPLYITLVTPQTTPGYNVIARISNLNPQGQVVFETTVKTDEGPPATWYDTYSGPFPASGNTVITRTIGMPQETISGTYMLTVTNRIDGYIVQRNYTSYKVYVPPPPVPLELAPSTIFIQGGIHHGIRGDSITATGNAARGCHVDYDSQGNPSLNCINFSMEVRLVGVNTSWPQTTTTYNLGLPMVYPGHMDLDGQGNYTTTIQLRDFITQTTGNDPWGDYKLCLISHYQTKQSSSVPPPGSNFPGAAAVSTAMPPAGVRPLGVPTPAPKETIPGQGGGEAPGSEAYWVTSVNKILACTPFTVDAPPRYQADIRMVDINTNVGVPLSTSPRLVVRGTATGFLTGTTPLMVRDTYVVNNPGVGKYVNEPEGNLWVDGFACNYLPNINNMAINHGRGGPTIQSQTLKMVPTAFNGPTPRGVSTDFPTALSAKGQLGPFLSFKDYLNPAVKPKVEVPFEIYFDTSMEHVSAVTVTLPSGAIQMATHQPVDPSDPTKDVWTVTLDVTSFPAGQVTTTVQAFGHYVVSGCPAGDYVGAPWPVQIVMVPAPSWLDKRLANPSVTFDKPTGMYYMSGSVGQSVGGGVKDWTVKPGGVPLDFLGEVSNEITAQVDVAEIFSIQDGTWTATAQIHGKSDVFCFPGDDKCKQNYSQPLKMIYPDGTVTAPESPSMPANYTWSGQTSINKYGPWTVYNGVIASYWGIVNVNLSISFGASSQALMQATFVQNLSPDPLKIIPQATLDGDISLWVDILMGVASAGVSGKPYLTVAMPVTIISTTVDWGGPDICFGLRGEVWASMLFWEATFGPFDIFQTGTCYGAASTRTAIIPTPPPSTLPAPSLASDGYGHMLGTWVHNKSNNPGQNVGVMYYVYWDGSSWSEGKPGIDDPAFLMSDPEVAFAGPGKAIAVFASNLPDATQPYTWTSVVNQSSGQQIAYSIFNGYTWTKKANLTTSAGPSGRVTLAGDPYHGEAMAAWVHDISSSIQKRWIIENARFIANTNSWTPVGVVISPSTGTLAAEPNLAYNSIGEAALAFVWQSNIGTGKAITSTFNVNTNRTLGLWKWSPWTLNWLNIGYNANFPVGTLMPSVAFDVNDRPLVAYTVYDKDKSPTSTTGLGNNNLLGYGIMTGTQWITKIHSSVLGVERPRMVPLKADLAVILYRGFGAVHTPEFSGAPMAVTINPIKANNAPSKPGLLVKTPGWMFAAGSTGAPGQEGSLVAMGVNNLSAQLPVANLSSVSVMPAMNATGSGAVNGLSSMTPMALSADAVTLMNISVDPDVAIDPADFLVGDTVPISGTSVPITVTVSNLGLAPTTAPFLTRVTMDEGLPGETEVYSGTVSAELIFMDTYSVTTHWHATSGFHTLIARVYPQPYDDLDAENNAVLYNVGVPQAPEGLTYSVNPREPAVGLQWLPSAGSAISGYVIYRATYTNTLAPLSWTRDLFYVDRGMAAGLPYRYAVSSFTDVGIESVPGAEVLVNVPAPVYLPIVMRSSATVE